MDIDYGRKTDIESTNKKTYYQNTTHKLTQNEIHPQDQLKTKPEIGEAMGPTFITATKETGHQTKR